VVGAWVLTDIEPLLVPIRTERMSDEQTPQLRTVFCTEHNSIWGDEEESFTIEDEHWYWMQLDTGGLDVGKCVPVNATVSYKKED